MIDIDYNLTPVDLTDAIDRMWQLSAVKMRAIEANQQGSEPRRLSGASSMKGNAV